jgi:hypothetical protein
VDLLFQALQGAIVNAQGAGGVVGTIAFDDTLPQMVRGVLGLILTTMASSARPISKAWQLASRSTLPEAPEGREQWWMYARLASAFPYSCWPQDVFERNLRVLAVRLLQQGVTEPLCVPLRRGSKQVEKQQQKQGKRQHEPRKGAASAAGGAFGTPPVVNEFVEYLQLCIACLERLATLDGPAAAKAAKAVLSTKPARPSSQRGNASSIFDRVSALLERLASRASSAAAVEGNDDDSDDDADRALLLSLLRNIVQGEVKDVVGGQARAVNRLQQLLLAAPAPCCKEGRQKTRSKRRPRLMCPRSSLRCKLLPATTQSRRRRRSSWQTLRRRRRDCRCSACSSARRRTRRTWRTSPRSGRPPRGAARVRRRRS